LNGNGKNQKGVLRMTNSNLPEKRKWIPDNRVGFSERNLNRWAIFGSRNAKIERILKRPTGIDGLVDTCHIGAVGYKNKMCSLSSSHGHMMNIIETIFYRQGMPEDNTIRVSSMALYNYIRT
jgi:hypothetical protein